MKYNFLLFIPLIGLFSTGCNTINPSEKVPTFVHIDSFQFNVTDPSTQGTAKQKITCGWVYFDNQAIGVFDLPANIPIIADAPGQVEVIPGVTLSGIKDYTTQYAFFAPATTDITNNPGGVINYTPKTSYITASVFQWKEDFETGNTFIPVNSDLTTDTSIVRVNDKSLVFEGAGTGYIYMDAAHPTCENICNSSFPITQGRSFLEINYKASTSFQIGLETLAASGDIVPDYLAGVKAKDTWNKLYVDLSQFTSVNKGVNYRVMIKAGLDDGLSSGYVLIDNIKVISF